VAQGALPEPGCEIVVPAKKKRQHTFNVATFAASMTSVATLATVVVSLVTLLKK
jgi:hypothetical protein